MKNRLKQLGPVGGFFLFVQIVSPLLWFMALPTQFRFGFGPEILIFPLAFILQARGIYRDSKKIFARGLTLQILYVAWLAFSRQGNLDQVHLWQLGDFTEYRIIVTILTLPIVLLTAPIFPAFASFLSKAPFGSIVCVALSLLKMYHFTRSERQLE